MVRHSLIVHNGEGICACKPRKAKLIFYLKLILLKLIHFGLRFCVLCLRVVVYRFKGKVGFLSFGASAAFEVSLSESAV